MRFWLALLGLSAAFAAGPVKTVFTGYAYPGGHVPVFDKGHLLYLDRSSSFTIVAPDGPRRFQAEPRTSEGQTGSIMDAAVNPNGGYVASFAFSTNTGIRTGLAFFDAAGRQIRFAPTGLYHPAHLCFDNRGRLWSFGWQRSHTNNAMAETDDYAQVRRYDAMGRETGAFLPRSAFPGPENPFPGGPALWVARASDSTIGVHVYYGYARKLARWIELDYDGHLVGDWKTNLDHSGGAAFTPDGRLFGRDWDPATKRTVFRQFDRATSSWLPIPFDPDPGLLLGADGPNLVFAGPNGLDLYWIPTPPPTNLPPPLTAATR